MDLTRKIPKKFTKKFGSKVINRQFLLRLLIDCISTIKMEIHYKKGNAEIYLFCRKYYHLALPQFLPILPIGFGIKIVKQMV